VLVAFADNWLFDRISSDVVPSMTNMFAGFALAVVVGVAGGIVLGLVPILHRALQPALEFLRAMPPPVFLSVGLLVLGTGTSMKVAVIVLGSVWPILLNTIDGVRGTDSTRLDMARVFGVSRPGVLLHVIVPSAAPRIMAGLRVALPLALVLTVISELVGSTEGLGYFVVQSSATYAIDDMWSGILLLGVIGWALATVMAVLENLVVRSRDTGDPTSRSWRKTPRKDPANA